jgi:hypothetical protein
MDVICCIDGDSVSIDLLVTFVLVRCQLGWSGLSVINALLLFFGFLNMCFIVI